MIQPLHSVHDESSSVEESIFSLTEKLITHCRFMKQLLLYTCVTNDSQSPYKDAQ